MTADVSQRPAGILDPRRNAFRPDLAAKSLEGVIRADRYVTGEPAFVVRAAVPLSKAPDPARGFETEALYGEGLGLDSIDILEVALVVSQRYGFQLRSDDEDNIRIFTSLASLTDHIAAHKV